ncbi:MAG: right-handed parallel beta-helix repeat-containing protein [candidate division Zixibacteria bacterium]
MKKRITLLITITIIAYALPGYADIIDIPDDYPTIQQGIDASTDGDTVLVQPGIYVENINFNGHNIVLSSLFLITGDTDYISSTIIDGDDAGSVVTFENEEDNGSCIMGFIIRNGYNSSGSGGGIFCNYSSPIIRDNIIEYNIAYNINAEGGGIYCFSSDAVLSGNTIRYNRANGMLSYGGGIYSENSNLTITNNSIWSNFMGGGIYCRESNLELYNNTVTRNWSYVGAGIYCDSNSTLLLTNSIVWGNDSWPEGSEIFLDDSVWSQISFCCIQYAIWPGEGNISEDPLFLFRNEHFNIMSTECGDPYDSPCIDTGSPAIIDSLLDCDWGLGTILSDMGAYGGGDSVMVTIDDFINELPNRFSLLQNFPNPFNPSTTIRYSLPSQSDVRIEIYNILGQRVATLFDCDKQAGYHTITWHADDYPSGLYFARLEAGNLTENIKMVLLK